MNLFFLSDTSVLDGMLQSFLVGVPKFVMAIVIALIGFIISKVIKKLIEKALLAVNVDKIGERLNEIEIVEKSNVKLKFSKIISKIVYYFLILFFMVAATDVLGMPAVSELVLGIFNMIPHLIVAMIVLVVGTIIADGLKGLVQTGLTSLGIPSARMIATFVFYFLMINIVVSALTAAKINTSFLSQNISLLIGGIILAFAIGYGLASQSSMSNFLASYYSKGKFDVGDTVTVDSVTGKIVEMDKSSMIIIADSGNKVIFPLSKVAQSRIEIHN